MKKRDMIILIAGIAILLLTAGITISLLLNRSKGGEGDEMKEVALNTEETPPLLNFDRQFKEGKITADEYVIYRMEEDNQDMLQMPVKYFIEDHFDELSEETLAYYYKKMSIEDMLGLDEEDAGKEAAARDFFTLRAQAAEKKPIRIVASPNKKFMVWYLTDGEHACTDELAQKVADTLEETVEKYDALFNTTYHFESKTISEGKFYDLVINIVKDNSFTEDDFKNAMQVYLIENKEAYATYYHENSVFGAIRDKVRGYDDNYSVMMPYVTMDADKMSDNVEAALQVANHELFHYYQYKLFPEEYGRGISDDFAVESTANWASCLVSEKTDNKGYLNDWAATARHIPNLLMDEEMIAEYGELWLSYAFFPYLYHYSENVEGGVQRIKDAMYKDDFFRSLSNGIPLESLNDIQESYMLGLLAQNYDNMNLVHLPREKSNIVTRKNLYFDYTKERRYEEQAVKLNRMGAEYYELSSNGKYKFTIDFVRTTETVVGYLVGEKKGEYTILDSFDYGYEYAYTFENDGTRDYNRYFFMVGNSTMWEMNKPQGYGLQITWEKIEEEAKPEADEEKEPASEIGTEEGAGAETEYKDYEEKIMRGEKITRDDLPESGYLTFRATGIEDMEDHYSTYYYNGDEVTRIVYTMVVMEGTTKLSMEGSEDYEVVDLMDIYIGDITNNPGMFKQNYVVTGRKITCEYTENIVKISGETVDNLIKLINDEVDPWTRMIYGDSFEYEFGFRPEL